MAKVSFMLKEPTVKGEESTLIYLIFQYGNAISNATSKRKYKYLKISTREKIKPKFWNGKPSYRAKNTSSFPEYPELNSRLDNLESKMMTVYRRIRNDGQLYPNLEQLKDEFEKEIGRRDKDLRMGVVTYIERQIKEMKDLRRANTIKKYNTTLKHLKDYSESRGKWLDFQDINMRFYADFHNYLVIEKGFSDNTFGKYIATLKGFLNRAYEDKYTESREHKHSKFKVLKEDVEKIYLTIEDLDKIYKHDFTKNKKLERVRDMFIIECFLGLRFSDMSTLSAENIQKADKGFFIKVKTIKTDEEVKIPIRPIVKEIFEKYDNQLPPAISNQKTNEYLKIIGRLAKINDNIKVTKSAGGKVETTIFKKYELITTHTSRRSFASNLYLAGVPAISIMMITGHRTEQAFLRYIRISPDENAMKLMDHPFFKPKEIRKSKSKPNKNKKTTQRRKT